MDGLDSTTFSIDAFWILKGLSFMVYGICLVLIVPPQLKKWLKEDGLDILQRDVKYRKLYVSFIYFLYIVCAVANCAIISGIIYSSYLLNMTILTSLVVVPMLLWQMISAQRNANKQ